MKKTFETLLVEQCAPTLAGLKPASLFSYHGSWAEVTAAATHWNGELGAFGIRVLPMHRQCVDGCLLYVYREKWLDRILKQRENRRILRVNGYNLDGETDAILHQLAERLREQEGFPHEIGVFLGYPARDVLGFIRHRGRNFKVCGYWKVYGDADAARRCFAQYRECTQQMKHRYESGTPVVRLTVAA